MSTFGHALIIKILVSSWDHFSNERQFLSSLVIKRRSSASSPPFKGMTEKRGWVDTSGVTVSIPLPDAGYLTVSCGFVTCLGNPWLLPSNKQGQLSVIYFPHNAHACSDSKCRLYDVNKSLKGSKKYQLFVGTKLLSEFVLRSEQDRYLGTE
jgi:hypothetical protein